jgi:hypothetical protein
MTSQGGNGDNYGTLTKTVLLFFFYTKILLFLLCIYCLFIVYLLCIYCVFIVIFIVVKLWLYCKCLLLPQSRSKVKQWVLATRKDIGRYVLSPPPAPTIGDKKGG